LQKETYKKENSIKKSSHDRSHSVDPKKKLLKKHKSRESIHDEDSIEAHKKQSSFSVTSKLMNSSKIEPSNMSRILSKGHH